MPIVFGDFLIGFVKDKLLNCTHRNNRAHAFIIFDSFGGRIQYLAIKAGDAVGGSGWNVHNSQGNTKAHVAVVAGSVHAYLVSPWTSDHNVIFFLFPTEFRALHRFFNEFKAAFQILQVWDDDDDVPSKFLGVVFWEMELLFARIDPHIESAKIDIGVARKAKAGNVKKSC